MAPAFALAAPTMPRGETQGIEDGAEREKRERGEEGGAGEKVVIGEAVKVTRGHGSESGRLGAERWSTIPKPLGQAPPNDVARGLSVFCSPPLAFTPCVGRAV